MLRNGSGTGTSPVKGMGKLDAFRVKAEPTSLSYPSTEMPETETKIQPTPHYTDRNRSDTSTAFSFAPEHGPCHAWQSCVPGVSQCRLWHTKLTLGRTHPSLLLGSICSYCRVHQVLLHYFVNTAKLAGGNKNFQRQM